MRETDHGPAGGHLARKYSWAMPFSAESDVGNIIGEKVEGWGNARLGLFGRDSINEEKVRLEGSWDTNGFVLCFDIGTELGSFSAPLPRIEGARSYIVSDDFAVRIQHLALKATQALRGYMQRWLIASMFWASGVQPVDLLLTYGSEECMAIRFPNIQIWTGYWDVVRLLHTLDRDE